MSLDPALRSRIESILNANRVVLFMKGQPSMPQCGFSAKAVGALQDLGVEFDHVNVLADADIREGIKAYGEWPTIPQLYIDGELIGGSDIILQMAGNGELSSVLGLAAPDRTPPRITVTPAAVEMLRGALADSPGASLQLGIDARFQPNFQLAPHDDNAIAAESNGLRVQFDLASARRAEGITIDWVDDIRGKGLAIDNPNAPKAVQELSVRDADDQLRAGSITVVDVRPADERAIAAINAPFETFDGDNRARLEALPKDTALAFLCHHGGRSAQAAEQFRALGFTKVSNITGGIDAWSNEVDNGVPKY
ncbi:MULTISPECIES: Grx4 family monothiol glutaredoxin [Gammaproteobacteria]|uniref:Monothiol glutaredoxin n=1 Tax=Stenotrophomonas rhizophila TaxID=216778 RepID=A0A3N1KEY5_9GAMM|nr:MULTISPECIES: Grx4 family monothiol glutaredoxin [Stenotrophomonas]MBU2050246.1 Grx4 family monothiol glutaredoxin [Gammaproteobacteria bacterium]KAB7630898.1 Grx4 family monothiol glutaredoxin [Stenotrophomonas rhizophila]MCW6028050.1 Grx4 family monothiol glutaredoxin [Stenotrophomonas sp. SRS1]RLK57231.1 monothiol glutaredoxin [Stenotrophomonas rhizophila]ROP76626.1 monothiol glutaredoxin [Stenotrophomonas rhizophila]